MRAVQAVRILSWRELEEEVLIQYLKRIKSDYWSGVKQIENDIYGSFQLHCGKRIKPLWLAFFINSQRLIFVVIKDETAFLKETREKVEETDLQEGLAVIFDELLKLGENVAEEMETYLINMEREIVAGRIDRNRNQAIFDCKRVLTLWKHDYEQLLNIAAGINGMSRMLSEECTSYLQVYESKVRRMIEQIQFLYEELVHVREALDAAIAYEQNRIMKVFTTVTTVFMPLTLVAGWYGMNFNSMPELRWRYGYVFVGVLSVAVVVVCIIFLRKEIVIRVNVVIVKFFRCVL